MVLPSCLESQPYSHWSSRSLLTVLLQVVSSDAVQLSLLHLGLKTLQPSIALFLGPGLRRIVGIEEAQLLVHCFSRSLIRLLCLFSWRCWRTVHTEATPARI